MNSINRVFKEMFWLALAGAITIGIDVFVPRPWMGAFWTSPLRNTRGPVWVNVNSTWVWHLGVFFTVLTAVLLLRLLFWLLSRKKKNSSV
ncbi:MAG: hypothetical protein IPP17_27375 [Bacteroidetes bacterium]|nr:hypothetical protein [Bacteroidota bacterium]